MRRWDVSVRSVAGLRVVAGAGAGLALVQLLTAILAWMLHLYPLTLEWSGWHLLTVLVFAAVGLLDDLWGDGRYRGVRGHLTAFVRHATLTTGALKLVLGIAMALVVGFALSEDSHSVGILNALLIALTAHLVNLLDVRPGRALKGYWLLMILTAAGMGENLLGIPVLVASVVFAWYDFQGLAALGDSGAMALGASLGFQWSVGIVDPGWKLVVVITLLFLSSLSEYLSFSTIIDAVPVLRYLDRLWVRSPERCH